MKGNLIIRVLLGLSAALMIAGMYMIFLYVPTEQTMGVVQRIFYWHVPLAWIALLAYTILFASSIIYLSKRDRKWDVIASASGSVGLIFCTLFLVTGSIWAKSAWGVWWTWDVRLTTALILWFIYLAYHMVRSYSPDEDRGARFAAVVGIIGFIDMPIVALANTLWRVQHPSALIFQGGLIPSMTLTLMVNLAAFTALFALLLIQRVTVRKLEIDVTRIKRLASAGGGD